MNTIWFITAALVLCGIGILAYSFFFASRIIRELESGSIKGRWVILRILILAFIAGYIGFWTFMPHEAGRNSLIVGIVFLFGAIFVLMVCMLMLQTVRDIKRINVLEQENITDPLMNIYNRRYLEQRLKEELARTGRYKIPLSLLLLDIDHFKQINDRYGHPVGDKVLSNMGEILKGETRKSDLPARYGGEEIAVLLPNTGEEEAVLLAERLRASIGYAGFNETEDGGLHCTVSIGVTSLLENSCEPKELLRRADVALYYAKQTGRNRVVSYKTEYEQS